MDYLMASTVSATALLNGLRWTRSLRRRDVELAGGTDREVGAQGRQRREVPDFTRGAWRTAQPVECRGLDCDAAQDENLMK
jgi:hypothetical protein